MIAALPARPALSDDVYEAIKALIMNHAIAPGSRLSIDQLARDLAVSPTPIHEALARLESDGLAHKESLRGYPRTPVLTSDLSRLRDELASMPAVPSGQGYEDYRDLANHE